MQKPKQSYREVLSQAPVALSEYGVEQAFYKNDATGEIEYAQTEKAVKFFVISEKYPGRRINFYIPKSLLVVRDGMYSHIKHHGIKILRFNIAGAVENAMKKWEREERNFDNRRKGGHL